MIEKFLNPTWLRTFGDRGLEIDKILISWKLAGN
jgi:hypothetical protein